MTEEVQVTAAGAAGGPRLGFGLPVSGPWADPTTLLTVARRAEALGFDALWTYQRLLDPADAPLGPAHAAVLDPLTALAFVAGHTERIGLGTATICAPFTAPALLAKGFASLDVLSGGRAIVGIGIGWLEAEYVAAGVPFRHRGARMEEYLRCLVELWSGDPASFEGRFYTVPPARQAPRPVQRPHPPILVGGAAPAALRRAGRLAQGWIASSGHDAARLGEDIATVREGAVEAGRDPAALRIVIRRVIDLGPDDGHGIDAVRTQLDALARVGVTDVIIDLNLSPRVNGPGVDPDAARAYADQVLEALAPGRE